MATTAITRPHSNAAPSAARTPWLARRPLLAYFALAYAITWALWLPYFLSEAGLGLLPGALPNLLVLLGQYGPSAAAFALGPDRRHAACHAPRRHKPRAGRPVGSGAALCALQGAKRREAGGARPHPPPPAPPRTRAGLERHAAGRMPMFPVQVQHLARFARFASLAALLDFARTKPVLPVVPIIGPHGRELALPKELAECW